MDVHDQVQEVLAPQLVEESRFDLGVDVVPAEEVDAFNDFLDSIGADQ
ncbi:hypothetical protein ACMHYB_02275 [Sorangium sp. So ce1128]